MKNKLLLLLVCLGIYQLTSYLSAGHVLPSVVEIFQTFVVELSSVQLYIDIYASLQRVLIGYGVACILGIGLGLGLGSNRYLQEASAVIELLRPIPPIAWIPIAILLFGLGDASAYFIVFLGAFFPIFTNAYFGSTTIPRIYKNISAMFELGNIKYGAKILLYYALPFIFSGLKIGIGMAWMSVIAAELMGAQSGLGYYIQINRLLLRIDKVIIGMILIGVTGFILVKLITKLEKICIPWRENL